MGILDTLLMIAAVVLIILSLLQSGKSDGLGSAFGGSEGLNLFANVKVALKKSCPMSLW